MFYDRYVQKINKKAKYQQLKPDNYSCSFADFIGFWLDEEFDHPEYHEDVNWQVIGGFRFIFFFRDYLITR